uniref:Peptidase C1A papain C-terminal domain-containing protein n=1 Tax=Amphimedon queenslandica TaxID=400682 RepID=A0A1X7V395_AMPQE
MAVVRYYGAKRDKRDERDYWKKYEEHQIPSMRTHPNVDFSGYVHHVYDQGKLESCTANALCAAYGMDLVKQSQNTEGGYYYFNPSRLFLYYNTREHEGTQFKNIGASIRDAVKSMNCRGVCKESDWPYTVSRFKEKPPQSCYAAAVGNNLCVYERLDQDINQFRACLKDNCPFVFGFTVYDSFHNISWNGYMEMPSMYERSHGRHAVLAVGYDDSKRCVKVLNSWGPMWGDNGYFYMPYEFIEDPSLCFDFWKISFACEQGKPRPKDIVPCTGISDSSGIAPHPLSYMGRASGYGSSGYLLSSRVSSKVSGHESSLHLPPIHSGGVFGHSGYPTRSRVNRQVRHYDWFDLLLSSRSGGAFGYPSQSRINRTGDNYDSHGLRRGFGTSDDDDEYSRKRYSSNKYRGW